MKMSMKRKVPDELKTLFPENDIETAFLKITSEDR